MLLHLDPHTKVRQLNRLLAVEFPFLKLAFYKRIGNLPLAKVPDNASLSEVNKKFTPGVISLNAHDSVAGVEQRFLADHKLNVQVLRKSGAVWLQTTKTDGLELQQQNNMGQAASRPVRINWNTLFL